MSAEQPIDPKKVAKKAMKKQVKKLVKAYGDEKALAIMTDFVGKATEGMKTAAGKNA